MKVNEHRTPPNGWHFPVDQGVTVQAHDKKTLIDRIFEYRIRNKIPTGNEERDIDDYFCKKWPSACNKEPADYDQKFAKPDGRPTEQLLYRVSRWASGLIDTMPRGGYGLVTAQEVERRAQICRACPMNVNWRTGCRGCSGSTVSLLNQVRRLLKAPVGLMGCSVLGFDVATASYLPTDRLPKSPHVPAQCWCK